MQCIFFILHFLLINWNPVQNKSMVPKPKQINHLIIFIFSKKCSLVKYIECKVLCKMCVVLIVFDAYYKYCQSPSITFVKLL